MKRRDLVLALGCAAILLPLRAAAAEPKRVGMLLVYPASDPDGQARTSAFVKQLAQFGWRDVDKMRIDYRWTGSEPATMRAMARALIGLRPDAIVVTGTPLVLAVKQLTQTIPIVFVAVSDPIGDGLVASLAHPGLI
jgi:putative tryptophan/tyrosine transport system substrate-binding protein